MRQDFKSLQINQTFHTGKAKGIGIYSNEVNYTIFKKIDNSNAVIIEEVNYHNNNRHAGSIKKFSAFSGVFPITEGN
jgi:hypothetical protein